MRFAAPSPEPPKETRTACNAPPFAAHVLHDLQNRESAPLRPPEKPEQIPPHAMARHTGFEPVAFGSGGGRSTSAPVGSPLQALGITRFGPAGGVHPSHPVAPVSQPFTARLLPRFPANGLAGKAKSLSRVDGRSGDGIADRRPLAVVPRAEERYLTVREVAERLRVSTATVYAAVKRGEIPHVRVSNVIRIPASALP